MNIREIYEGIINANEGLVNYLISEKQASPLTIGLAGNVLMINLRGFAVCHNEPEFSGLADDLCEHTWNLYNRLKNNGLEIGGIIK